LGAQYKTIDELTIPSPNSSSLGIYGQFNLNNNSGAINLNIPLKTLNFYGLELPININYFTQGLRPNEEASRFGLGWTSSFEPIITRNVKGLDDLNDVYYERSQIGYVNTDEKVPEYGMIVGNGQENNDPFIKKVILHNPKYMKPTTIGWDTEQDDFTLNIFGETVSFVLSQKKLTDNKIIVQYISNDKNYKIEYKEADQTFEVVNNRGFVFKFLEKEFSVTAPENNTNYAITEGTKNNIITAWKLSKIIAPNQKEINYSYERISTQSQINYSNSHYYNQCRFPIYKPSNSIYFSSVINIFSILELKKIESDLFNIEFTGGERNDIIRLGEPKYPSVFYNSSIPNSNSIPTKIDKIIINNLFDHTTENFKFYNSYYNSNNSYEDYNRKNYLRLKLDKIEKNNEIYYQFDYKKTNELPEKRNFSTDFWGFYNGKISKYGYASFTGDNYNVSCEPSELGKIFIEGDNKMPDYLKSQIGTLESVIYPTKGYSKFITEANIIAINKDNEESLNISNYGYKTYDELITESVSEEYPISEIIEITEDNKNLEFTAYYGCAGQYQFSPQSHQKCSIDYKDRDKVAYKLIDLSNNNIILQRTYYDKVIPYSNTISGENISLPKGKYLLYVQGFKHISNFFNEQDGIYQDQSHPDYGKQYNYAIKIVREKRKLDYAKEYNLEVGGIRVKEIINYDYDNKLLNRKTYEYLSSSNFSSGILSDPLWLHQFTTKTFRDQYYLFNEIGLSYPVLEVFNTSILDSPSNSFIGYRRIIEKDINTKNEHNGKKVSYYNHDSNIYKKKYNLLPYMIIMDNTMDYNKSTLATYPRTSFEFSNSKLIKEEFFNNQTKIKEKKYYYDYPYNVDNFGISDIVSTNIKMDVRTSYEYSRHPAFNIVNTRGEFDILQIYRRIQNNPMLIKTIDTDFFENSNDSISSTTNYSYNRFQLTKQTTTSTKDEVITTEYKYPSDLTTGYLESTKMNRLVNENRIAEPVIVKQKVGNTYVSEVHNQYAEFYGLLQKSAVFQKKGEGIVTTQTTDRKIVYNSYDAKGNITQYTVENGLPVAIIWGYNTQYPIAKIEGANYSAVEQFITDLQNLSNEGNLAKDSFSGLRTALPNAMITTYVYKPLVGVTQITGPNGISENYKYDSANRLEEIKNDKNEVLKTFQYNYKP